MTILRLRITKPFLISGLFFGISFLLSVSYLFKQRPLVGDLHTAAFFLEMAKYGSAPLFFLPPVTGVTALLPNFIFYGGQFFYVLGYFSNITRLDSSTVISIVICLSIFIYLTGTFKICRYFKLSNTLSFLISVIFCANPYYLTNLFGRNAFNEFVAQSFVILALGMTLEILANKVTKRNFLTLTFTLIFLFSVHNLTLFLFMLFSIIFIPFFYFNRVRSHKNYSFIILATLIGVLFNYVYILHIFLYSKFTWVAFLNETFRTLYWPRISSFTEVFLPLLHTDPTSGTRPLFPQTIFVINLLLLIAFLNLLKQKKYVFVLISMFPILFFLTLSSFPSVYKYLPSIFFIVQFPYRYVFYLTLSIFITFLFFYNLVEEHWKLTIQKMAFALIPFSIAILIFQSGILSYVFLRPGSGDVLVEKNSLPSVWMAGGDYWDQSGTIESEVPSKGVQLLRGNSNFVDFKLTCSELDTPTTLPITGNFNLYEVEKDKARILGNAARPANWLGGWIVIDSLNCVDDNLNLRIKKKDSFIGPFNSYLLSVSIGLSLLALGTTLANPRCQNKVK
jgi:hypothetical protein